MVNINLVAQQDENPRQEKKEKLLNRGLLGIIIIFILTLASYFLLLFLQKKITGNIAAVQAEYNDKLGYFKESDAREIVDFQNRINVARGLWLDGSGVFKGVNMKEVFGEIEKLIISKEVYLSSLKYDEQSNSIAMVCIANNYNIVAKQILGFKSSSYLASVAAGRTSYNPDRNIISFDVSLRLK